MNSSRGEAARAVAALFTVVAPAALAGLGADAGSIAPSSSPLHLTVCGDFVYFSADDGTHGRELWAADLSAICRMVADIQPGPVGSGPEFFSPLGDRALMFCAKTEASGKEPWVVDDMAGTVRMLADLFPGTKGSDPVPTAFVANRYFLTARLSSHTIGRFLLLGTIPGGAPTALIGPLFPGMYDGAQLTPSGVVCAGGDRIWYSDGTENGTRLLFRFESGASRVVDNIVSLGPRIVFRAYDRDHGMELWGTDGTPAGTGLIKDIAPGPDESVAGQFERVGGVAYFQADDASRGLELWVTDGTPDGTRMVKDINPGGPSSDPHYFTAFGDWVYFCADDGRHGIELWRTDGTDEGTVLAADVYPGQASGQPWSLCAFGQRFYFCALTPQFGEEVYSIERPGDTAALLRDIVPGPANSGPDNLTVVKDRVLFFTCDDGDHGEELWMTEGHGAPTRLAADINVPRLRVTPSSHPRGFVNADGRVVFAARDAAHGEELWSTDGTEAGTALVADLSPGPEGSGPEVVAQFDRTICVAATAPDVGRELFVTDGTPAGTALLKDIAEGASGSAPGSPAKLGTHVYFIASQSDDATSPWRTDGTATGTVSAGTLSNADAATTELFALFDRLYAYAYDTHDDWTLYAAVIDPDAVRWGALENSKTATEITVPPAADESASLADAGIANLVRAIRPPNGHMPSIDAVTCGGYTYFVARTAGAGAELWKTDGTSARTTLVRDLFPGPASSSPAHFAASCDTVFFVAECPNLGRVLCRSDGTADGTYAVKPLDPRTGLITSALNALDVHAIAPHQIAATVSFPGAAPPLHVVVVSCEGKREALVSIVPLPAAPDSKRPKEFARCGEHIVFAFDDGEHGEELWGLHVPTSRVALVKDITAE